MAPFMKQKDPALPPGQVETQKFPVLHVGNVPDIDPRTYALTFTGLLENPFVISYDELRALPSSEFRGDIHCVTRWSKKATYWHGTLFRTLVERARPQSGVTHVIQVADNDYTTNLPLAAMLDDDVLVAWEYDGRPLEPIHGGPVRMLVPERYFWKSAKWLRRVVFTDHDEPGFWETNGYHNDAFPWQEQRYAALPQWMSMGAAGLRKLFDVKR
jgi:DMSO/TMAO reductase YedYZ molybdopterin-dependent catalytic subunit